MGNYLNIYKGLAEKFLENFNTSLISTYPQLEEVELKAQAIYHFGNELKKIASDNTQIEVSTICSEIFSDLSVIAYLSLCSINNAAKVLLRRVLELGVAIPVFWNLPHKFWGWKEITTSESDLNFKDNLEYLGSLSFKIFLKNENNIVDELIRKESVNKFYRELSNIIHGKYSSFETTVENAYCYNQIELQQILKSVIECENILLTCFQIRFNKEYDKVIKLLPGLGRYNYEY